MRYTFIILTILFAAIVNAQNSIDKVLIDVAKNNKSIIANQQFWEAKKLLYITG